MKTRIIMITLAALMLTASTAGAATAVFAGGCFWCMEADFEKLEGVSEVISGFTGGEMKNPTYNGNHTGHYEAVEVHYDENRVSYQDLLDYYWVHIDPFDRYGQFCDKGHSYLSAIFVANPEQKKLAEASLAKVKGLFPNLQVATEILPAATFWPIKGEEDYHQDFYKKSPIRYKYYRNGCGRDDRVEEIWGEGRKHL